MAPLLPPDYEPFPSVVPAMGQFMTRVGESGIVFTVCTVSFCPLARPMPDLPSSSLTVTAAIVPPVPQLGAASTTAGPTLSSVVGEHVKRAGQEPVPA